MKKLLLFTFLMFAFVQKTPAQTENIAHLTKIGFFDSAKTTSLNPVEDVRKVMLNHVKYTNEYNAEKLKSLYAQNYLNADGFNKDIYFELIKKTWAGYPDIKYKMTISSIQVNGNNAIVQASESAFASTDSKPEVGPKKGQLENYSSTVYYLENTSNEWKIVSDYVLFEKTFLTYGSAQNTSIDLIAPSQVPANTEYSSVLKIQPPKDSFVIASIGKENITYPQTIAEEVFRKLPESGELERLFKSNNLNINEYTVGSFGVTKAEIKDGTNLKIYITGLGFAMSRVNVIPENKFIKVEENEQKK